MSTTTIRLPDDLKDRLSRVAEDAGTTAHNFIVQAVREQVEIEEERAEFHRLAQARWAEFKRTGEAVSAQDMKRYVHALAAGKKVPRPSARKIRL